MKPRLSKVLERISDGVYAVNDKWEFTYVNENAEVRLGHSEEELRGECMWDIFPETTDSIVWNHYHRAMESKQPVNFDLYCPVLDIYARVNAYPSESGLSVYFRDVTERTRRKKALDRLHGMNRELLTAQTEEEIVDYIIDGATEILDFSYLAVYLFDEAEVVLRPVGNIQFVETPLEELPVIQSQNEVFSQAFLQGETVIIEDISETDADLPLFEISKNALAVPIGDYGLLFAAITEASEFDEVDVELTEFLTTNMEFAFERIRSEQEAENSSALLREKQVQLKNRNQYASRFRDIYRKLMSAESRTSLEQAVCDELVTLDRITFAWTGRPHASGNGITPGAWSGGEKGFLDAVSDEMQQDGALPSCQASFEKEPVVIQNVGNNIHSGSWVKHAIERQYRSAISVPIVFDDVSYGVLTAYSHQQNAFNGKLGEIHATLGELMGYAASNLVLHESLNSDQVLLLEFDLGEPGCFIRQLARLTGCSFRFESLVSETDDSALIHLRVIDGDPESVVKETKRSSRFSEVRQFGDAGVGLVELRVQKPLILTCLKEHGILLRRLSTDGTTSRILVKVASSADPRPVIELITTHHPDATLLSRQVNEQSEDTGRENPTTVLTDRQREIATAAYEAGYFEQPRKVTGEEIAESLGISGSAFSKHMQAIQSRMAGQLFDINADN